MGEYEFSSGRFTAPGFADYSKRFSDTYGEIYSVYGTDPLANTTQSQERRANRKVLLKIDYLK